MQNGRYPYGQSFPSSQETRNPQVDPRRLRRRMVREQLEARGISHPGVLAAMGTVPRHLFVQEALRSQAYEDTPLPIGYGQTISQPYIVALMSELLEVPVVVTVVSGGEDVKSRIDSGASILNVSAAAQTPEVVREIRAQFPKITIIATGGPTDESILETIHAGANAITWTPPSTTELFRQIMVRHRETKTAWPD